MKIVTNSVRSVVRDRVWNSARDNIEDCVSFSVRDSVEAGIEDYVMIGVFGSIWDSTEYHLRTLPEGS